MKRRPVLKVTIYGASDDLIEIEGDLREEFNPDEYGKLGYLAFSDGTLLSIQYSDTTDWIWRINRLAEGLSTYSKTDGTDSDDDYTDKVTLEGDSLSWVVYGHQTQRAKKKGK